MIARRLMIGAVVILQVGCAATPPTNNAASASRPPWACRLLDGTDPNGRLGSSGSQQTDGGGGGVATALVLWPVLIGVCLATR